VLVLKSLFIQKLKTLTIKASCLPNELVYFQNNNRNVLRYSFKIHQIIIKPSSNRHIVALKYNYNKRHGHFVGLNDSVNFSSMLFKRMLEIMNTSIFTGLVSTDTGTGTPTLLTAADVTGANTNVAVGSNLLTNISGLVSTVTVTSPVTADAAFSAAPTLAQTVSASLTVTGSATTGSATHVAGLTTDVISAAAQTGAASHIVNSTDTASIVSLIGVVDHFHGPISLVPQPHL
jgi:hypothetical protein